MQPATTMTQSDSKTKRESTVVEFNKDNPPSSGDRQQSPKEQPTHDNSTKPRIDTTLPVQTRDGNKVTIVDVRDDGDIIAGVIHYGGGHYKFMEWNSIGEALVGRPELHEDPDLENVPGFDSATVHLNVYKDEGNGYTTGYGYKKERTALKYARKDKHLPHVAEVKTTLVFPEPHLIT